MDLHLRNKTALVSGPTAGIGFAIASLFPPGMSCCRGERPFPGASGQRCRAQSAKAKGRASYRTRRRLGHATRRGIAHTRPAARRRGRRVDLPLRHGTVGLAIRAGGVLAGPVSLLLRMFFGRLLLIRRLAGMCFIVGALLSRFA
jgi:hypothetical protein